MKLYVYDVIGYEKAILEKLKKECQDIIEITTETLTMETLNYAKDFDGISVLGYSHVNKDILHKMKDYSIKHISTRTIGYDHFDIEEAKKLGIQMYHAHYNPNNVADFAVMLMLIMLRKAKISICRALVNDFSLDGMMGREIKSLTIGIIGTGKIGSTVAKNLSGFGCRIIAYDKYLNKELENIVEYVELQTIYEQSNIITLHTPLTDENYHLINKTSISKMKKGVILINTARGQLIDTEALIQGLENEHIGGAGIDTVEEEEGIMHQHVGTKIVNKRQLMYLKQFPNVLYTQHYAFFTQEATESMTRCGINSLQDGYNGIETSCKII